MNPIKLIVSSKNNLKFKYGNKFSEIEKLLKNLQVADKKKGLDTRIVFIDDATSAKRSHIKAAKLLLSRKPKELLMIYTNDIYLHTLLSLEPRIYFLSRRLIIPLKMKILQCHPIFHMPVMPHSAGRLKTLPDLPGLLGAYPIYPANRRTQNICSV